MTSGSQTMPEMALKNVTSGLRNVAMGRCRPATKPAATPVAMPSAAPPSRRARLASVSASKPPDSSDSQKVATTAEMAGMTEGGGCSMCQ